MEIPEQYFDLGVAWNWEFDRDFIGMIGRHAETAGMTTFQIHRGNVAEVTELVRKRRMRFRCFFDRASDEDENFLPLVRSLLRRYRLPEGEKPARPINPHDHQHHAADKATMHLEFLTRGIAVPYTIIVSPYNHKTEVELSLSELARLGRPFIIKPANTTGGGIGVVTGAESLKEVLEARQAHKNDKYLLQETVRPAYLGDYRAWFRVFFAFGEIIPCWWDDQTHIYETITPTDEQAFNLGELKTLTRKIQEVCKLDFFSTEVAYTRDSRFVSVDYVNEICDMRLQSRFPDGVPDLIVENVARLLIQFVASVPR
ncbi:MAG: hypothetical protein WBD36_05625 [Bacteroidota bacterium]